MALVKWQPRESLMWPGDLFDELTGLRRLFDQPFESFFGRMPVGLANGQATWRPAVDVAETKDAFVVKAEIPGVKADDIHISVEGDMLIVTGERKQEKSVEEEGYTRSERAYGTFERRISLPPTVDVEGVKASYTNGVLEVRLPKKEEAKPKRIPVQTA
jgi:HSP20 family protein